MRESIELKFALAIHSYFFFQLLSILCLCLCINAANRKWPFLPFSRPFSGHFTQRGQDVILILSQTSCCFIDFRFEVAQLRRKEGNYI